MDKGKQKMTAQEYEQDRRSKKMARNPPSQERLHLQPAAPLPSAMGKGKRKMTIDEYEEDRLSNNAKKPPTEGLLYLQPSTPMPLTPAPLPLSPLGGSLMATNATQMDFAPMEVPVDAPMEVPVDAPMDAQLEVPMDAPMEAPIDEVMRRDFQPILTRRQIAQRARRQREQGARILDICDDLKHKLQTLYHIPQPSDEQVLDYGLHLLDEMLFEGGKRLTDFPPMPLPVENWSVVRGNPLIWEQQQFQYGEPDRQCKHNVHLPEKGQPQSLHPITLSLSQSSHTHSLYKRLGVGPDGSEFNISLGMWELTAFIRLPASFAFAH